MSDERLVDRDALGRQAGSIGGDQDIMQRGQFRDIELSGMGQSDQQLPEVVAHGRRTAEGPVDDHELGAAVGRNQQVLRARVAVHHQLRQRFEAVKDGRHPVGSSSRSRRSPLSFASSGCCQVASAVSAGKAAGAAGPCSTSWSPRQDAERRCGAGCRGGWRGPRIGQAGWRRGRTGGRPSRLRSSGRPRGRWSDGRRRARRSGARPGSRSPAGRAPGRPDRYTSRLVPPVIAGPRLRLEVGREDLEQRPMTVGAELFHEHRPRFARRRRPEPGPGCGTGHRWSATRSRSRRDRRAIASRWPSARECGPGEVGDGVGIGCPVADCHRRRVDRWMAGGPLPSTEPACRATMTPSNW